MRGIKRLGRDERGVAYLEFALAMPLLLALLMGAIEVTRYMLIAQKVEKVAVTISDVVAQSSTITTSQLSVAIQAAGEVMQPYDFECCGYVIISSVTKTGTANPKVNWQYKGGGANTSPSQVGTPGNDATLPAGFTMNDRDNIIISEVFYNFAPILGGNGVIGNTAIYKIGLYKPRLGDLTTLSALPFWLTQKGAML